MAKKEDEKKDGEKTDILALLDKPKFRRPEVGETVQFLLNKCVPLAAVVVAAYSEKNPNNTEEFIEYVNLRCFEDRRTTDTPYYARIKFGTEPGNWRFIPSASKDV